MSLPEDALGWALIGFGLAILTEGYHRFRCFAQNGDRPGRYWWLAGIIGGPTVLSRQQSQQI